MTHHTFGAYIHCRTCWRWRFPSQIYLWYGKTTWWL